MFFFFTFPMIYRGRVFSIPSVVWRVFRRGTRYIVGTHDTWWIVVEIRRGKHDSTSRFGTKHMHILCNRFKNKYYLI
jgi:hypothetical protein